MKNKEKIKETQFFTETERYRKEIYKMVSEIDQTWILMEIIRFIQNITK